ncbi:YhbY family RNA-binding protein [Natronosalvus caseinilyticus]|uniref:YhbY family RNA-binding protein n=1 Tax=Natronosalvus caseinilyticus TaxID=2953747 RepID=UPI0028AA4528|nr:YhbY family RNA-binding protein [Natronosalvus caseinilyticus]
MNDHEQELKRRAHDLDVTVWVGKSGADAVVDELNDQLANENLVKVKFLRAARAGSSTEEKAADLAERVNGQLIDTRGHTAVIHR